MDTVVRIVSYDKVVTLAAKYFCSEGYIYTRDNNEVTCTDPSRDLIEIVGNCVKGNIFILF